MHRKRKLKKQFCNVHPKSVLYITYPLSMYTIVELEARDAQRYITISDI